MSTLMLVPQPQRKKKRNKQKSLLIAPSGSQLVLRDASTVRANNNVAITSNNSAKNRRRRLRRKLGMAGNGSKLGAELVTMLSQRSLATNTVSGMVWLGKVLDPSHPSMDGCFIDVPDRVSANVTCAHLTQSDHISSRPDATGSAYFVGSRQTATTAFTQTQLKTYWDNQVNSTTIDWNMVVFVDPSVGTIFTMKYFSAPSSSVVFLTATNRSLVFNSIATGTAPALAIPDIALFEVFDYKAIDALTAEKEDISKMRMVFHGTTCEFTGPTVRDQGELVAAQITPEWRNVESYDTSDTSTPAQILGRTRVYAQENPSSGSGYFATYLSSIVQASPKSYSTRAREGYYCPSAIWDPIIPFRDVSANKLMAQAIGDVNAYVHPALSLLLSPDLALTKAAIEANPGALVVDVFFDRFAFQAQVAWFTGIDVKSTFKFTTRYGLAMQPNVSSVMTYFATPSPKFDEVALNLAIDIRQEMDDFYPSSYNSLGTLWQTIKEIAAPIYRAVKPMLGTILTEGVGAIPGLGSFLKPAVGNLVQHMGLA